MAHREGSTWSWNNSKGLQFVDKPKSVEQGQEERFTEMSNPVVWFEGIRG